MTPDDADLPGDPHGDPQDVVRNAAVRTAVAAFAAAPSEHTSMEVLRQCLHGELLLDITGSEVTMVGGEPAEIAEGATLQVHTADGPDGAPVLLAFTSPDEIEFMHPPGTRTQGLGQPATAVVEFACAQDGGWLAIDAGGTTCALPRELLQFAAEVPRNDAVREAVGVASGDPSRRAELLGALRAEGVLLLAADPADVAEVTPETVTAQLRGVDLPDGRPALLAFTSAPELLAGHPRDSVVVHSTAEVLAMLREGDGYRGLVVNQAGPAAAVTVEELLP